MHLPIKFQDPHRNIRQVVTPRIADALRDSLCERSPCLFVVRDLVVHRLGGVKLVDSQGDGYIGNDLPIRSDDRREALNTILLV